MKKIVISIFYFSLLLGLYPANVKLEKIGVIDLQKVVEVCFQGKSSAVKQVVDEKEKFQKELDDIKQQIITLQNTLDAASASDKANIQKEIDGYKEQYTALYRKKAPEIEKMERSVQAPLFNEIYNVAQKIAETEGYSVILKSNAESLFYYSVDADITDKVVDYFNKNQ